MKVESNFENILEDLNDLNDLLEDYFLLVYKDDFSHYRLTESEDTLRKELVEDIASVIVRLSNDNETLKTNRCKSEDQKNKEDRNLVDLAGQFTNILLKLKRYKEDDAELKSSFDNLKNVVSNFKMSLNGYIERSDFEVLNWQQALEKYRQEIDDLEV